MPPVKMTRAEYEAKYSSSTVPIQKATSGTPIKMTSAEYQSKFGTTPTVATATTPTQEAPKPFKYSVDETRQQKLNKYTEESNLAKEAAHKANSFIEKYVRPVADSVLTGVASLGDTIQGILNTNKITDTYLKTFNSLQDTNLNLQKQIGEGERSGKDVTKLKQIYNENVDMLDRVTNAYNDATAGAQKSDGQVAGELGLTALNILTAGTYGKASGGVPSVVKNAQNVLNPATGLFTKEGLKSVALGSAKALPVGYGYDVSMGAAGMRGEDRTGVNAFIPGAGTAVAGILGAAVPALEGGIVSAKRGLSGEAAATKQLTLKNNMIAKREEEIFNIENNYAKTRKAMEYSKDANSASRKRVASTDVLVDAVDENGLIKTKGPGGAAEKYEAQTVNGGEGVVRIDLEREGATIDANVLADKLKRNIENNSLIKGHAKTQALEKIDKEVAGYTKDASGRILLTELHDAKIATYKTVKDFATPAEYKTYQKSLGYGLKKAIEDTSNLPIEKVNAELAKYYQDIELLKNLDGKRVKGGKLGKYFAKISGNIVGGLVGNAIGGPVGSAVGTIAGGELASKIKGNVLSRTLGGATGTVANKSPILEEAITRSKSPRLALPEPKKGAPRSSVGSGATIRLPTKSQSVIDEAYSKSLGSRNAQYSATSNMATNVIPKNTTTNKLDSQVVAKGVTEDVRKAGGVNLPKNTTQLSAKEAVAKGMTEEQFVKVRVLKNNNLKTKSQLRAEYQAAKKNIKGK